jgi:RNA polymerase sigma-70 factor, ECF subfamily
MSPLTQDRDEIERCVSELRSGIKTEENFRWIFTRYYRPVFCFFAKRRIPDARCDDLTQEVFLRVYRGIGRFRGEARFETWLFQITWNLWRKKLHDPPAKHEISLEEPIVSNYALSIEDLAAEQDDPLDSVLAGELKALVYQELERMPPQMRRCILLRVDRGLKYREIAALMQISIDAVKSHLNQAKTRLKDRLGDPTASGHGRQRPDGRT